MPYVVTTDAGRTGALHVYSASRAAELIAASDMYTSAHAEIGILGFALEYQNTLFYVDEDEDVPLGDSSVLAIDLPLVLARQKHEAAITFLTDAGEVSTATSLYVDNSHVYVTVFDNADDENLQFLFPISAVRTAYGYALWDMRTVLLDESRGIYIPQMFIRREAHVWQGVSDDNKAILASGPDHPEYQDAWDEVLQNAIHIDDEGITWRLEHDGDLWMVPENAVDPENA